MKLLYERGTHALSELSDVDDIFKELKKTSVSKARPLVDTLEKKLSKIFGTTIVVELQNHGDFKDNFAILPILHSDKRKTKANALTPDSIKLNEIEMLYLLIGVDLIQDSKPRQLTAILLHEVGHTTQHISAMSTYLIQFLQQIQYISDVMSRVPVINFIFSPLFIITTRSLNFKNHALEYNADKFAIQYGYGDDLTEWCLQHLKNKNRPPANLTGAAYMLKSLFEGSSHPSFKKRVFAVIKEMKNNYAKEYGNKRLKQLLDKYYTT